MKLLSDAHRLQIESHLAHLLERVLHAPGLAPLSEMIRAYVLAGGKRIRPQLCAWTYLNSTPQRSKRLPEFILDLAGAWELFHAFVLCHDDIIDGADHRRAQASLHRQLQSLDHNCPKFGMNLGIVAGDLLFSSAMRLWHELDLPAKVYRDELTLFSRIACTTGFGQAIDICQSHVPLNQVQEETLLREYHWKTAAYTFEGPMLSGAIAAGADAATRRAISSFALALGQAYQLQNDLLDLAQPSHEGSDLMQGKRTMTLLMARRSMSAAHRQRFDRELNALASANGKALSMCESLRLQMRNSEGVQQMQSLIGTYLTTSAQAAQTGAVPKSLRTQMRTLLASLKSDYFDSH